MYKNFLSIKTVFFLIPVICIIFVGYYYKSDRIWVVDAQKYIAELKPSTDIFVGSEERGYIFMPVANYYGLTKKIVLQKRKEVFDASFKKLYNLDVNAALIPLITHRLWVTSPKTPCEPPKETVERYIESVRFLQDKGKYTHYFWCQKKIMLPKTIERIEKSDVAHLIKIRELSEIEPLMRCTHLSNVLIDKKYYPAASDFIRTNLIYLFGGIYTDFGWLIKKDITPLLGNFNYLTSIIHELDGSVYLDKNLFAAKKYDHHLDHWLNLMHNCHKLPKKIRDMTPVLRPQTEWMTAGYTSILPALLKNGETLLPINTAIVDILRYTSWQKSENNFGNANVNTSSFNLFSVRPKRI